MSFNTSLTIDFHFVPTVFSTASAYVLQPAHMFFSQHIPPPEIAGRREGLHPHAHVLPQGRSWWSISVPAHMPSGREMAEILLRLVHCTDPAERPSRDACAGRCRGTGSHAFGPTCRAPASHCISFTVPAAASSGDGDGLVVFVPVSLSVVTLLLLVTFSVEPRLPKV